jgi:hypothetical protein
VASKLSLDPTSGSSSCVSPPGKTLSSVPAVTRLIARALQREGQRAFSFKAERPNPPTGRPHSPGQDRPRPSPLRPHREPRAHLLLDDLLANIIMLDIWHCQAGGVCLSRVLAVLPHEVACGGSTSGSATEPCSDGSNDVYSFVEMLPLVARRARASGCGRLVSWTPRPPPCGRALSSATHKVESDEPVIDFGAGVVDKVRHRVVDKVDTHTRPSQ